jgi:hypothetical protein
MTRKAMHGSARFADVAQLIAPNNTPAWLAEMLGDWTPVGLPIWQAALVLFHRRSLPPSECRWLKRLTSENSRRKKASVSLKAVGDRAD